ncbi:MAG: hypothetical protein U1E73_07890 [Planctomycetota bacterium]
MASALRRLLLPDRPRDFPGRRGMKIALRAVHVLCAGIFVGAHVFAATADDRTAWCAATVVSGGMLLLLDLHESAAFLLQVRGAVVLAKLAGVAALPWLDGARQPVLATLFLVAVASSHAPAKVRYHLLVGSGRLVAGTSRG